MSRRVVALGDRFDSMKKKKPSAGTDKRRSGKNIEIRGKRSNKLDQKRGKKKTQQQQPKKKKPVPKKKVRSVAHGVKEATSTLPSMAAS